MSAELENIMLRVRLEAIAADVKAIKTMIAVPTVKSREITDPEITFTPFPSVNGGSPHWQCHVIYEEIGLSAIGTTKQAAFDNLYDAVTHHKEDAETILHRMDRMEVEP